MLTCYLLFNPEKVEQSAVPVEEATEEKVPEQPTTEQQPSEQLTSAKPAAEQSTSEQPASEQSPAEEVPRTRYKGPHALYYKYVIVGTGTSGISAAKAIKETDPEAQVCILTILSR